MVRSVEIALSFLTIFRIRALPPTELAEVARHAWAFPIVGMMLGGILCGVHWLLADKLSTVLSAVLVVGTWIVLTGGLHLDGWADCGDALVAAVPPDRRLEILKDSRLGTFGALALMLLLGVKVGALAEDRFPVIGLFLAPTVGRGLMIVATQGALHRGEGMAAQFIGGLDRKTVWQAAIIGLGPVLLAGWTGIAAALTAYVGALSFRRFAETRLGMINGDVMGATCELSEAIFLLVASARW